MFEKNRVRRDVVRDVRDEVSQIRLDIARIEAALVVRDPGNTRSVEAYDGLRKQVAAASGDRRRLLVALTELSEAIRRGESTEMLGTRILDWANQTGLTVLSEFVEEHFELVDGEPGPLRTIEPAYVDIETSRTIRRGLAAGQLNSELVDSSETERDIGERERA